MLTPASEPACPVPGPHPSEGNTVTPFELGLRRGQQRGEVWGQRAGEDGTKCLAHYRGASSGKEGIFTD